MTTPLLVETVTARSMAGLRAARDAVAHADMVELRLDGVADLDVAGALEGRARPVIVTCRPTWEGGRFDGTEEDRRRILVEAARRGAEYVDVEWRAAFAGSLIQETGGGRIVVSSHDFEGVPADLADRVQSMRATGAEVIKIAVTARRLCDALPLREVTRDGRTVAIAMGDAGVPTRLLAARFGSCWTYAGETVAPGQIPAERMVNELAFRRVGRQTSIYGLAGSAVLQSQSPAMHNAAFGAAGLDAVYVPLQTTRFDDFTAFADAMGVAGASVTIPFKRDALRWAARRDEAARTVGAANTLRRTPDGWEATNTDLAGFLAPLEGIYHLGGKRAAVLGAGGAARAVVVGLEAEGARVTVHARREEQAREVAALVGAEVGPWPPGPGTWDLLVNCTPLGGVLHPDTSPLPRDPFDGDLVYDLISRPAETRLVRDARAAGCRALGGLPMLVAQAERQFEWWTGTRPPAGLMTSVVTPSAVSARG